MKLQLISFFVVQIACVVCTHRRHGTPSRNSASFLLRKVCVEVTGLKEEVAGLKEENSALKEKVTELATEVTGLEAEVTGLEAEVTGLEAEVTGLEAEIDGLKEENSALNDRVSAVEQAAPTSAFSLFGPDHTYKDDVVIWSDPELNQGSHYNTTTGRFCPEYSGTYLFHLDLYKMSQADRVQCGIFKSFPDGGQTSLSFASVAGETSKTGDYESSTTAIVHLEQGDCVYVGFCVGYNNMNFATAFVGTLLNKDP